MHAFLIIGNNTTDEVTKRIAALQIAPWDIVRPNGTGIPHIRAFIHELAIAPRGEQKVGVIEHVEDLSLEAQNALLKTIEEPPAHVTLIATAKTTEALLPTICSRMTIERITNVPAAVDTTLLDTLLASSPAKRLADVTPFLGTREDAKALVLSLLRAAQFKLHTNPSQQLINLIRNLFAAQTQLATNVNQRLVIDNTLLTIL